MSDIGNFRRTNQDRVAYVCPSDRAERDRRGVFGLVADGMGGHRGGEVASAIAVDVIRRQYFGPGKELPLRALERAFVQANRSIYEAARNDAELFGMGTTATAVVLLGTEVLFAHVGDSRLYRCSAGCAETVTEDDSFVMAMVRDKLITPEQARHHPDKNLITSALGTREEISITVGKCDTALRIGDRFVLCSDGLHDVVLDEEIAQIVCGQDAENACHSLVEMAKARGSTDNISVGVLAICESGHERRPPRTTRDIPEPDR